MPNLPVKLEFFITRRIARQSGPSFSRFIIRIATAAVALSVAVMIIATAMVTGFQKEISNKVYGYWGHIHITPFGFGQSLEDRPISTDQPFYPSLEQVDGVAHIQVFANKAGIIKTDEQIEGIILRGVGADFKWDFFKQNMVAGDTLSIGKDAVSDGILLSRETAERLRLKPGDDIAVYFIQQPPRMRKLTVTGIYNTGLGEYDRYYALVDIAHVQRLNNWKEDQVGGFEVYVSDVSRISEMADEIYYDHLGNDLFAQTIKEINPNIFEWLQLQTMNEIIIILLMVIVAAINMVTCLLILILERTNMIGTLKALGAQNSTIRSIFIYQGGYILGIGLLVGNLLGIGVCLAQEYFQFIRLPEESYYVSIAPIYLNWWAVLAINAGSFVISLLVLLVPSLLISRITPIRALRFD